MIADFEYLVIVNETTGTLANDLETGFPIASSFRASPSALNAIFGGAATRASASGRAFAKHTARR